MSRFSPLSRLAEPADMFHPRHYIESRDTAAGLKSLPPWAYTSDRFLEREMQTVFRDNWNVIERTDRIPVAGDYFTMTFLGAPLLVTRGQDMKVRVFANVCRHRSALVAMGEGKAKSFRCAYHSWTYGLDGGLMSAPDYRDLSGNQIINDTNRKDYGLVEINSALWGGFIFIRFADEGLSLEEQLGDVATKVANHHPEDMVCTRRKVFEIDTNWKLFVENVNETYHIPHIHGQTLDLQKRQMHPQDEVAGNYVAILAQHEGSRLVIKGDKEFPRIPTLEGRYGMGTYYCTLYPGTMIAFSPDGLIYYQIEPLSPSRTRMTVGSCFPKDVPNRPDFDEVVQGYYKRVDLVIPEDVLVTDTQQIGLTSAFTRPSRLGHLETMMHAFDQWLMDKVIDEPKKATPQPAKPAQPVAA